MPLNTEENRQHREANPERAAQIDGFIEQMVELQLGYQEFRHAALAVNKNLTAPGLSFAEPFPTNPPTSEVLAFSNKWAQDTGRCRKMASLIKEMSGLKIGKDELKFTLRDNKDFMLMEVKTRDTELLNASVEVRNDPDVLLAALKHKARVYTDLEVKEPKSQARADTQNAEVAQSLGIEPKKLAAALALLPPEPINSTKTKIKAVNVEYAGKDMANKHFVAPSGKGSH